MRRRGTSTPPQRVLEAQLLPVCFQVLLLLLLGLIGGVGRDLPPHPAQFCGGFSGYDNSLFCIWGGGVVSV